ncbi:MAG: NAD-dependent epimerase/dehydratase family protein [Candidatus Acidiferrales bacterium]
MKVFIAGASGVLGRRLVRQLVARGHSVIGQVRSAKAESAVREAGGEARHADLFDAESLARAAEGCDTVIHAATAIPTKQKTTLDDWAMNDHIRRKGTRCLTEAAAKIGAKTYIQQSVVWVANPKDGSAFDEDSPIVPDSLVQSSVDAEAIAREAGSSEGFSTAILRGGAFYDCDSAHIRMLAEGIRKRAMPIIGRGDAVWSVIHTDDAASAYVAVAERPRDGVWHIVEDEPVSVRVLLESIAERLGAPRPRRVPVWLARWLAGERAVAYFTRSTRTTNARFRRDFGWAPRYPTYREGLDQIVAAWDAETSHQTTP